MAFHIVIQNSDGKWSVFNNENCEVFTNAKEVANRQLPKLTKFTIVNDDGRKVVIETGKLPKGNHEIFSSMGIHPVEEFLASRAMSSDRSWPWKRARGD